MGVAVTDADPAFWREIAGHPDVQPHMGAGYDIGHLATHPDIVPIRAGRGGFLFHRLQPLIYEMHALFEPSEWGRGVNLALKDALGRFAWQAITVREVGGWWRSRPPLSFGFRPMGEFDPSPLGLHRPWLLTHAAWMSSPARMRMR